MSAEHELVKVTKFKGEKYDDRQDYLAALLKDVDRFYAKNEDKFDNLSDEAADWYNAAVTALNKKKEIPDFEDDEPDGDAPVDPEELEADDDTGEVPETGNEDSSSETTEDEEPEDGDEPVQVLGEPEEDEPTPEKPAKAKAKVAKSGAMVKGKPKKEEKPLAGPKKGQRTIPVDNSPVTKDRFGVIDGSKTSEVVKLYEKGITGPQIYDKFGGRYYNILRKLAQDGHRVEKLEGGIFKLTHRDDVVAKPVKKK